MEKIEKISILECTNEHVSKLRKKYAEYCDRYGFMAPEINQHGYFKYCILHSLLENKILNYDEETQKYFDRFGGKENVSIHAFNDAWGVINRYACNEASQLFGGTGLK